MRTIRADEFDIAENRVPGLSGMKEGQRFRAILNYAVVEKTKSYTMTKIKFLSIIKTKRAF